MDWDRKASTDTGGISKNGDLQNPEEPRERSCVVVDVNSSFSELIHRVVDTFHASASGVALDDVLDRYSVVEVKIVFNLGSLEDPANLST